MPGCVVSANDAAAGITATVYLTLPFQFQSTKRSLFTSSRQHFFEKKAEMKKIYKTVYKALLFFIMLS